MPLKLGMTSLTGSESSSLELAARSSLCQCLLKEIGDQDTVRKGCPDFVVITQTEGTGWHDTDPQQGVLSSFFMGID